MITLHVGFVSQFRCHCQHVFRPLWLISLSCHLLQRNPFRVLRYRLHILQGTWLQVLKYESLFQQDNKTEVKHFCPLFSEIASQGIEVVYNIPTCMGLWRDCLLIWMIHCISVSTKEAGCCIFPPTKADISRCTNNGPKIKCQNGLLLLLWTKFGAVPSVNIKTQESRR